MSPKTLKFLAILFVILGIAASYPLWIKQIEKRFLKEKPPEFSFSTFSKNNTEKIVIKKENEEINLEKDGENWQVNSFAAEKTAIDNFFQGLFGSTLGKIVSKNKENHESFGVTEATGILLTLKGSFGEKKFFVGKVGPELNSFYTRKDGENNVYLATGSLKENLLTSVFGWREKTIINLPKEQMGKIEVIGIKGFTLAKNKEGKWEIKAAWKTKILTEEDITPALSLFSPLSADGFIDESKRKEFTWTREQKTVRLSDIDNKVLAEFIFASKESDFWCQLKGKEEIFEIYSYKLDSLFKLREKI